ncbi:MAG: HYR domain-containing protein [Verrucomicrobiales bacterium]|nr:HYR domain-containing protein [Verrucomicrobiales bacterium]
MSGQRGLALVMAGAIGVLSSLTCPGVQLWDEDDYVVATGSEIVVMDQNFQFKAAQCFCGPYYAGGGYGSLDWFGNGDLLVGLRFDMIPIAFRYDHNGIQTALLGVLGRMGRTADYKVSFNQQDMFVGGFAGGAYPSLCRIGLDPGTLKESTLIDSRGGIAVVPRLNGSHELWVAFEGDFLGIRIYLLDANGVPDFGRWTYANPAIPAGSVTMTYDPGSRRVLFSNLPGNQVFALDVETRALARTYTVPANQAPAGLVLTGLTSGPNGIIIAMESYEPFDVPGDRRVGLSIWDADGSNYRFVNLDNLPGYDFFQNDAFRRAIPYNILWTGNSPEFRNGAPSVICADSAVFECVPPEGLMVDINASVTDVDHGQTLNVTLEEGGAILRTQTVSTPADAALVTFRAVPLAPGDHRLAVRVSDGRAAASGESRVTLLSRTGPDIVSTPPDATVECDSDADFGIAVFSSACDPNLTVTQSDEALATSGLEKSKIRRTWTATDDEGLSATTSQTLTVLDTVAPHFDRVPSDITVEAAGDSGAQVTYAPAIASDACGTVSIQYSVPSGSTFVVGTTTVIYTAIDMVGNRASASFNVTVKTQVKDPPPALEAIARLDALSATVQTLSIPLIYKTALQLNLASVKAAMVAGCNPLAVELLKVFEGNVDALARKKQLTTSQATQLKSASASIRAILTR